MFSTFGGLASTPDRRLPELEAISEDEGQAAGAVPESVPEPLKTWR
jgi:hypothetical protein